MKRPTINPTHGAAAFLSALTFLGGALVLGSCAKNAAKESAAGSSPLATAAPAAQAESGRLGKRGYGRGGGGKADRAADREEAKPAPAKARRKGVRLGALSKSSPADDQKKDEAPPEPGVQTRAWFPETFLFKPLVVTDAQGKAAVSVRVPDRLTTWRVLALAHSRGGAQAGHVASFLGTLPVYVDPIVPKVLRSGDEVRLPINIVNTTAAPVTTELRLSAVGVELVAGGGTQQVTVPAAGSLVRYATLKAGRPGEARVLARLAGADSVVRVLRVIPLGRPVRQTKTGTLASPRELTIERAQGADATLGRVRLQVFPGALALLRSELASAVHRGRGLADDAFALLLAGRAPALLSALGDAPALETSDKTLYQQAVRARAAKLRDLTMLTTQRVLRHARVLDITSATLLAEAAAAHPDNPVLSRLGERAVNDIARKQLPDGTCGGETGWTLQRLLVATADCVRAAPKKRKVVVRASGAFERHADRIKDAYTASAVLASGAVSEALAQKLRQVVLAAVKTRKDGSKVLIVPDDVVRADGRRPGRVEASALAVLALKDVPKAPVSDLGAAILSGYSPAYGWGDGRANLVCMKAALELFRNPLPAKVRIVLLRDGQKVAEQALDRQRLREVVVLEAAAPGTGRQQWKIIADPAVAGLGFSMALTDRVPWPPAKPRGGVELAVTPPAAAAVGQTAVLAVKAIAPGGRSMKITLELPAGVQLDKKHLDKLVSASTLQRYTANDAEVVLFVPGQPPAKAFGIDVRVIPTLGGAVQSGASALEVSGSTIYVPPARWAVK